MDRDAQRRKVGLHDCTRVPASPRPAPAPLTNPLLSRPQARPLGGGARPPPLRPLNGNAQPPPAVPKHMQRWLSSSSDSSDSDDGGGEGASPATAQPAADPAAARAAQQALMHKLGITGAPGWESDESSWFSSPEPLGAGGRRQAAPQPAGQLERAERTIAALQQELAAARAQADAASAELREADAQCRALEVGGHASA